jgi:hypothetical protein
VDDSAGDHAVIAQCLAAGVREREEWEWGYVIPISRNERQRRGDAGRQE